MPTPDPPRLAPVPFAEWDEGTRTTLLQFLAGPSATCRARRTHRPCRSSWRCSPSTSRSSASWLPFTEMLAGDDARLRVERRELLILRVAWRTRSGYEWAQHRRMAGDAGLTAAQIDAVTEGPSAPIWTPLERTLLTRVDEMIDDHVVGGRAPGRTWPPTSTPAEMFELLFVVGGCLCLAGVLDSIGLQGTRPPAPEDDRRGAE